MCIRDRASLALDPNNVASAFNLAMARWTLAMEPDRTLFGRVLSLAETEKRGHSPNFRQSIAVARFLTDDASGAKDEIEASRSALRRQTGSQFSCWRYLVPIRKQGI